MTRLVHRPDVGKARAKHHPALGDVVDALMKQIAYMREKGDVRAVHPEYAALDKARSDVKKRFTRKVDPAAETAQSPGAKPLKEKTNG